MNPTHETPMPGRTALVTGASSGMGAAIAARLAQDGADVVVVGRRRDLLHRLADSLDNAPGSVHPMPTDITSDAEVERLHALVNRTVGGIDILVNSAGVMLPNPLVHARADEWATMIDTNLSGLLRVTRAFLPDLLQHDGEVTDIINISSIAAHVVFPDYAVYAATKAAVTTLSALQRTEVGRHGVRVTNLEPGLTATELGTHIDNDRLEHELGAMFDAIRAITPEDIADLVAYVLTRPSNVNLRQVIVLPTEQA